MNKKKEKRWKYYPSGTLLWSHRCVQHKPLLGMASDIGEACSLKEAGQTPPLPFCFWFSDERSGELSLCIVGLLPVNSGKPTNGLIGEEGEEFKETTEGGEVNEAGARTVRVRSSDIRFETWRVKTCKLKN